MARERRENGSREGRLYRCFIQIYQGISLAPDGPLTKAVNRTRDASPESIRDHGRVSFSSECWIGETMHQ